MKITPSGAIVVDDLPIKFHPLSGNPLGKDDPAAGWPRQHGEKTIDTTARGVPPALTKEGR